ncbi:MAG: Hsp20/alpha crystallin family protein [Candidatus Aenigmarchaeota archaeon]|nr:Hsp20/alpha crystallin family protein [Candidatus Aenigmarchaeota archaeon]
MKDFKFYWEKSGKRTRSSGKPDSEMRISVPGYLKDEISVKLTDSSLRVSAEKKHHRKEKGKGFYREESMSQSFSKFVSLPNRINPDYFEVKIEDGHVTLKRKKKAAKEKELRERQA